MFKFAHSFSINGLKNIVKNEARDKIYNQWISNFSQKFMKNKEKIKGYLSNEKIKYKNYLDSNKDKYKKQDDTEYSTFKGRGKLNIENDSWKTKKKSNKSLNEDTFEGSNNEKMKKNPNKMKNNQSVEREEIYYKKSAYSKIDFYKNYSYLFENEKVIFVLKKIYGLGSLFFSKKLINEFTEILRSDQNYQNYIKDWENKSDNEKYNIFEEEDLELGSMSSSDYIVYKPLFDLYLFHIKTNYFQQLESLNHLTELCNLTQPENWFPATRMKKRVIYYHMGPTNSGKTFAAIEQLKKAKTGVYLSPLRLLACEIAEKLNKENIKCSMETGQEKILIENATHFSCTIEIAPFKNTYDCAVIDEVQMIADDFRGDQWTNAILGIKADEVHLCGEGRALKLVAQLCQLTGEPLIKKEYTRLSSLNIESQRIHSFSQLKKGDCIITFSKKNIFKLKNQINKFFGDKSNHCSVIYGALPPEVKKIQAQMFNNQDNKVKFLIATDAIGMGLNLKIKRIIFYETFKVDDTRVKRRLTEHECRQIAGRAGRSDQTGYVSAVSNMDLIFIRKCMKASRHHKEEKRTINEDVIFDKYKTVDRNTYENKAYNSKEVLNSEKNEDVDIPTDSDLDEEPSDMNEFEYDFSSQESSIQRGCIFPTDIIIQEFAKSYCKIRNMGYNENDYVPLSEVLTQLENLSKCSDLFFLRKTTDMIKILNELKDIKADIKTQFIFSRCPIRSTSNLGYIKFFFMQLIANNEVKLPQDFHLENKNFNKKVYDLKDLPFYEDIYNVLECYIWLGKQFGCGFVELELARVMRERVYNIIDSILHNIDYDFEKDLKSEKNFTNQKTSEKNTRLSQLIHKFN